MANPKWYVRVGISDGRVESIPCTSEEEARSLVEDIRSAIPSPTGSLTKAGHPWVFNAKHVWYAIAIAEVTKQTISADIFAATNASLQKDPSFR